MLSLSNVEATPARTYDEVAATRTMIDRTEKVFGAKAERLAADTAYGTGKMLAWLLDKGITPHIPVWERYQRTDGMFPCTDFALRRRARHLSLYWMIRPGDRDRLRLQ